MATAVNKSPEPGVDTFAYTFSWKHKVDVLLLSVDRSKFNVARLIMQTEEIRGTLC